MDSGLVRTENKLSGPELQPLELTRPSGYLYPTAAPQEPGIADYWRILVKHKWVVLSCVVIVVTLAAIGSFRATPLYEAVGRIAINRENADVLGFKNADSGSNEDWDYQVALDTQVKILQSDVLALQVTRDLHLDTNEKFLVKKPAGSLPSPLAAKNFDPKLEAHLLNIFRGGLSVVVIPRTRIVAISYLSPDPRMSAEVVNALASAYVEQNFKTKFESTMQTSEWLSGQLSDLQMKVETSQEKLVRYQKEHGILGIDEKQNIVTSKLDELNKGVTQAEGDRIQKESLYKITLTGNPELIAGVEQNTLFQKLRAQEADLQTQYAQTTTQFGPSYPKVAELRNQLKQNEAGIQAELSRIGSRIKNQYLTAVQREKMLRAALEEQKREANQLNESAIQYNLLKRDLDTNRQLYEGLLQKLKEAGVSAGLRSSNVRIVDPARVPIFPAKPNIPRNLILALLVGLTGGMALAFLLETMDNTVRTPEQVQSISALPSLGIIPHSLHAAKGRANGSKPALAAHATSRDNVALISHSRPKSEIAESYRALRTSILLSSLGSPPKVILVTSALPQEGKTTTSINCAIVLAQKGARVLLVDADLRRPGIHHFLGLKASSGLSTLLTGRDSMEQVLVPWPALPSLSVLPAGPAPPHPAELLGSELMRNYLHQWREQYDHVVIDTPPALSVTDAVLLSVEADSVLLVIRSGVTTKEALRRARDLLHQVNAKITGVVVNAVDLQSPDLHYYYYGSKYGGRYYEDGWEHRS